MATDYRTTLTKLTGKTLHAYNRQHSKLTREQLTFELEGSTPPLGPVATLGRDDPETPESRRSYDRRSIEVLC